MLLLKYKKEVLSNFVFESYVFCSNRHLAVVEHSMLLIVHVIVQFYQLFAGSSAVTGVQSHKTLDMITSSMMPLLSPSCLGSLQRPSMLDDLFSASNVDDDHSSFI